MIRSFRRLLSSSAEHRLRMTDNEVLVADDECTVTSGRVIGQCSTDTECLNGKGIDNSP